MSRAKAMGHAHPERAIVGWIATCTTCIVDGAFWHGEVHNYKGAASDEARRHNQEKHGA